MVQGQCRSAALADSTLVEADMMGDLSKAHVHTPENGCSCEFDRRVDAPVCGHAWVIGPSQRDRSRSASHLPLAAKKLLGIEVGVLTLRMPEGAYGDFRTASAIVSKTLEGIEGLPVIPREVEDILTISSAERHRWLKDGRLQSTGTRTVKLRGRARKVTFHVFDPRHIEDVLDRDLVTVWREDDAIAAAENRRRAAGKAALKRAQKSGRRAASAPDSTRDEVSRQKLKGWDEFESDGLLR